MQANGRGPLVADASVGASDLHGAPTKPARRGPIPRARLFLGGLGAIALAVVVGGSWSLSHSSSPSAQASPSFAVYAVNPGARLADIATCSTPAQTYGQTQADWGEDYFIGVYLYVNFTGQPDAHVAALRALLPSSCAVYVRIVPISSAAGRALQERIEGDMASLQAAGIPINSVGFNPMSDKVEVGVYPLTPQAQAELERRYPTGMLDIHQEAPAVPVAS